MKLHFTKMHGAGNDFIVIDAINQEIDFTPAQWQRLADRRFGIGADQILVVEKPRLPGCDFRYRIYNNDGGEVIFDANGAQTFFNLMGANYNYFEGITFRNANLVFLLGLKNIAGSSGFTLKHSRLYDIGRGVQADWSGSKNFYIADNSFIGRHDPQKMMG